MGKAGTAWTLELGKAEQLVLGSAREDTAVHVLPPVRMPTPTSRLLGSTLRRMAGAREVNIGPAPLVVVSGTPECPAPTPYIAAIWKAGVSVGVPTLIARRLESLLRSSKSLRGTGIQRCAEFLPPARRAPNRPSIWMINSRGWFRPRRRVEPGAARPNDPARCALRTT